MASKTDKSSNHKSVPVPIPILDCHNGPRRIKFGEGLPFSTDWKIMVDDKEKYQCYLCSREWAEKRQAVLDRCGGVCERCNANPAEAIHHLSYKRKYQERLEDLTAFCSGCHSYTHGRSDIDPLKESKAEVEGPSSLLSMMIVNSQMWGNICVCPHPDCDCDNVHITNCVFQKGNDNGDADWEGRGDLATVSMSCEYEHEWEVCFGFHKGTTAVFVRRLRYVPYD